VDGEVVACVEVGASTVETVLLGPGRDFQAQTGAHEPPPGVPLLLAVPGYVHGSRVLGAANLGWDNVDPAEALGLAASASLLCNDAEAAALGESVLRPGRPDLVFVGLGTGVGGAVVRHGAVQANLFAHQSGFGERLCTCSRIGCLETVAGGWALADPLAMTDLKAIASAVAHAVSREPAADAHLVVVAGGMSRAYPVLLELIADALPSRDVQPTASHGTKSAAAWGLRDLLRQSLAAVDLRVPLTSGTAASAATDWTMG